MGTGLVHEGVVQELRYPVIVAAVGPAYFRLVAAAHHQKVPHLALLQVLAGVLRGLLREDVDEALVQGDDALLDGKADGGAGEALAEGEQDVLGLGGVGGPGALGADLAVAQELEGMHLDALAVELVQHVKYCPGGYAD